jgi:hypothetical protein
MVLNELKPVKTSKCSVATFSIQSSELRFLPQFTDIKAKKPRDEAKSMVPLLRLTGGGGGGGGEKKKKQKI